MNSILAGHYATEVFGVRSLAKLLGRTFKPDTEFLDLGVAFWRGLRLLKGKPEESWVLRLTRRLAPEEGSAPIRVAVLFALVLRGATR